MKNKETIFLSSIIYLLSAALLTGCATSGGQDKDMVNPALLEPQATQKFSDVPVPAGFKLLPQESYSFETSGIRMGLLRYQGKAEVDRVVNFYKEQMVMYGWQLLNIVEYGQRMLNFERDTESCIINLIPHGGATTITVSLGPKSQAIAKKTKEPIK